MPRVPCKNKGVTTPVFPPPLGLHVDAQGTGTYAVPAPRAERIELCVFGQSGEVRFPLSRVEQGIHWGPVAGLTQGTRYGLRAFGPWEPQAGHVFNPDHVLLDPYANGIAGPGHLSPALFHHEVDQHLLPLEGHPRARGDNSDECLLSVVTAAPSREGRPAAPGIAWSDTVIYEAHVKGLTALHGEIPEEIRGTYAALGHPALISHLASLGITALQLLPIHAKLDEPHLARLGLRNYWGYNTASFFAPEPSYASPAARAQGPGAVLAELCGAVDALHAAGIEVFLDVVYNHTCEGDADGPIVSLRGIDAEEYYWRHSGHLVDVTGTGNTLNMRSPFVVDLVLQSLRFWANTVGVDGFRFDLASTLGRSDSGFHSDHPLLRAMQTDPALRGVKLIAEPWDVGSHGWQTGNFPTGFAEWNDSFRDDVRRYWLEAARDCSEGRPDPSGLVRDLATRLSGSADIFRRNDPADLPQGRSLRAPWASVNFVTAHDGFTLLDLCTYNRKHNEANGEQGRDGTENNRSFNHGFEGPTAQLEIVDARDRSARNIAATLLASAGVPMLTAGDEFLRSQGGNNNAYCQDNVVSYVSWEGEHSPSDGRGDRHLNFVRRLLAFRASHPQLRPTRFLTPARAGEMEPNSVAWFRKNGRELTHDDWFAPGRNHILALLPGAQDIALIAISGADGALTFTLPGPEWLGPEVTIEVDSSLGKARLDEGGRTLHLDGPSVVLLHASAPCTSEE